MEEYIVLSDLEALHAQLDLTPHDWDLRLVLADLLEEDGDELGAAYQRWAARERKSPHPADPAKRNDLWFWWHDDHRGVEANVGQLWFGRLPGVFLYAKPGNRQPPEKSLALVLREDGVI